MTFRVKGAVLAASMLAGACTTVPAGRSGLASLPKVATVDARFQSYNVEMVEVTGGRFWAPYGGPADEIYRFRPPVDLRDARLIALARHLGPAYVRVSGTWANNTYLPAEGESVSKPPSGFQQLLTRDQWKGVIAFSKAVDGAIVTSFAASIGTRDRNGDWQPGQAQRLLDLTRQAGGRIDAAEFFNEPNLPAVAADMPEGYTAQRYGKDFRAFKAWAEAAAPDMKLIGPGSLGEGSMFDAPPPVASGFTYVPTKDMLAANPGSLDAVSYHFYGGVSPRCAKSGGVVARKEDALTPGWLDRTLLDYDAYAGLRDRYEPGKPIWNTETAQAACGGSPWASTFLDSFRYLNQLGVLAQKGVQVVMHNTLVASDYALIDHDGLTPRPNYWAALLWHRTMGRTVLAPPSTPSPDLRVFAHCLPAGRGGVGLAILNLGTVARSFPVGTTAMTWVLSGQPVDTSSIRINGSVPAVTEGGGLTGLAGVPAKGGLSIPGQAIAFVAAPDAGNAYCR
ncbi:hypothetical protein J3E64_000725 [Sphingobium sp. OAS761]|uniref:hypothetical protein n=1 Tax=Sphingobium sp. OAS761 TaxID=2817901 RepID=UPI0020A1CD48|nr:hypothetical protein [Sphingobium sp. OAS761]MCP1469054.1 hypothetical protein [Sphingobium sp. OAS761]